MTENATGLSFVGHSAGQRIAGVGLVSLLTSCGLLTTQLETTELVTSTLPAAVAAWTIADVCRREIPAADPLPMHAWAPVMRDGGSFLVHYGSHDGGGFRVVMNGRLTAPKHLAAGETGDEESEAGCRFIPAKAAGHCGLPDESIHISIDPCDGGSSIQLDLTGRPAAGPLLKHVHEALRTMALVLEAEQLQRTGETTAADLCAREALRQETCCAHHNRLTARLLLVRAQAMLLRQDLSAARQYLRQALLKDPGFRAARSALATTEQRLGTHLREPPAALPLLRGTSAILPAANPGVPPPGRPAGETQPNEIEDPAGQGPAGRPAHQHPADRDAASPDAPGQGTVTPKPQPTACSAVAPGSQRVAKIRRRAQSFLAAGDPVAARAWAEKAQSQAPRSAATARLLTKISTTLNQDETRVLQLQWMTLEDFGFDADLVHAIVESHLRRNNPATGLRVLLHFYEAWPSATQHQASRSIARLVAQLPHCQALRILSRTNPALAIRFAPRRQPGPAFASLMDRVPSLRDHNATAREDEVLARATQNGYRLAPGVQPAAPLR